MGRDGIKRSFDSNAKRRGVFTGAQTHDVDAVARGLVRAVGQVNGFKVHGTWIVRRLIDDERDDDAGAYKGMRSSKDVTLT